MLKNTISNGLIINVIKLSGYMINDTNGTTNRLLKIDNIFISQFMFIVIGSDTKKANILTFNIVII